MEDNQTESTRFQDPEIAVAFIAKVSRASARSLLIDDTVAGRANLVRILSAPLHPPFPDGMVRGSPAWREWCEAAETAVSVQYRARREAVERSPRTLADRDGLRVMAETELTLLDEEVRRARRARAALGPDLLKARREERRDARAVIAKLAA